MSAGICIMNRQAIALAADSAVTIGDHAAIHNSANKLFSLSKVAPVGLIIYANASLMTVPMEIIVKEYKKQLGDKTFAYLSEYVSDFLSYVGNNAEYFRFNVNEESYIRDVVYNLWRGLEKGYQGIIEAEKQRLGHELNETELAAVAEKACQQTIDYVDYQEKANTDFFIYLSNKYQKVLLETLSNTEQFKWLNCSQRERIVESSLLLFDTKFERNGYLGISIAGYGENEIYPSLIHLHLSGCIDGRLRYFEKQHIEITESQTSSITPLAQTDVMETFLFGINDRFLTDLATEIPRQIDECIGRIEDSAFPDGKKDDVRAQLKTVTSNIIDHMLDSAGQNYMKPILDSVSTLPIEELALLAESMINITSIRRKVALDRNIGTVGGPIDVAIISKGDGFIWLKRKHYFEGKYNPQYYYSHFDRLERRGDQDECE